MKKIMRLGIALLLMSVVLLGCQQQDNKLELKREIKEVNIFKSNKFKKENSVLFISFSNTNDTEILEIVKNIINDAIKQEGIVDITEPDYDLEIIYEDDSTKELYLWLLEGGIGSLMEVEDTHTVYNFSEELNNELIDLIELDEN
ncbi:MAG TPA: hypothetical protein GXZ90_02155 [Clostridiales bacterium]|nr:hypothetical protein [Clostridiales bacterium]